MRIQDRHHVEGGGERITLVPDSLDDLWHLQYVVEPGDRVSGDTTRRITRNDDQMRDTGGEREHMWIELTVESVEFHKFANRLRIGGEIADCPREDQLGLHHTLNVEVHDEIEIEKRFKPDQLERLDEAVEATDEPDVAIATVEEGEAAVYTVEAYGTEERATITATTGKGEYSRDRDELFAELAEILGRMEVDAVVLAGPGFTKQDALDYIREENSELAEAIRTVDTSAGGDRGVHEVLKRGAVEEVRDETRIAQEAELIDELTKRIGSDEPATYGPDNVAEATEFGAVETLLVLDDRLRIERGDEGDWDVDADHVVERVEQQGGDVVVFSSEFDPGQQLANLGGIAAILRYRID